MSIYSTATIEDFSLSGPHVWPKITSETTVDRFIIQRPELAYLQAKRKMEKKREEEGREPQPEYIGVRITRQHQEERGGKIVTKTRSVMRFFHRIDRDDSTEDVRSFLARLRHMLKRCMPDKTTANCWGQLRFYDKDRPGLQLLMFHNRWL